MVVQGITTDNDWSARLHQSWLIYAGVGYLVIWLLSVVAVFEPPIDYVLRLASSAGCYGVQILLTNSVLAQLAKNPRYYVKKAARYKLAVSYHQPWDIPDFAMQLSVDLGYMSPPEQTLKGVLAVLRQAKEHHIGQVVVHSNLWPQIPEELRQYASVEPVDTTLIRPDNLTCSVFDVGYALCNDYRASHEWVFSRPDTWNDRGRTMELWRDWWGKYGRWCREIHLYDILPGAGRKAKNRLPGTGRLPLKELRNVLEGSEQTTPGAIDVVLEFGPLQLWISPESKIKEAVVFTHSCFVL
ncbi:MAG: hypothetical protein NTY61_02910 [Candidatus Parcubacteria bacterium]|nr:hypothetical protein [Candidatus Parcubacteria bacterium]